TADGGQRAEAHARDATERLREHRQPLANDRRQLRLAMRDERAETHCAVRFDAVEAFEITETDETGRSHEPLPHHRHERGAARDHTRVVTELLERCEHFVERPGRAVLERIHRGVRAAAVWIDSTIL